MASALTDSTVDDATTGVGLIEAVDDDIARVTADAAYDTVAFYEAAGARGATVVVPPTKTARVSRRRPRSSARDRTITAVQTIGRRRWKKLSWGHAVSEDLVRWKDLPIALYPDQEHDCFSGQTLVEDDRVIAIYHGTRAGNAVATASDPLLVDWRKHPGMDMRAHHRFMHHRRHKCADTS